MNENENEPQQHGGPGFDGTTGGDALRDDDGSTGEIPAHAVIGIGPENRCKIIDYGRTGPDQPRSPIQACTVVFEPGWTFDNIPHELRLVIGKQFRDDAMRQADAWERNMRTDIGAHYNGIEQTLKNWRDTAINAEATIVQVAKPDTTDGSKGL